MASNGKKTKSTKIICLEVENFKRLRAVEITPAGTLVVISGKNAQGKSSLIDAIWAAMGGRKAIPRRPVREGADEARIHLELEDLVIDRRIKPDGSTQLVVSSPDGARYPSPQAVLDALVGSLMFDPLAFTRMDPKKQRELLRELVGLDTSTVDGERQRLYDERTQVNREAKRVEGELSGVPRHSDAPATEISMSTLTAELVAAEEHARQIERAENETTRHEVALTLAETTAAEVRAEIAALEVKLAKARARIEEGERNVIPARRKAIEEARTHAEKLREGAPDRGAIRERIDGADKINAQVRDNRRRAELKKKHDAETKRSEALTKSIDECDRQRAEMIAAAAYPLPGLGVDEEGVTLGGLPLEQASSAEQLRASVAIGLAQHPQLRVLLVRDGSLLDADSLRLLHELATEADAQVFLERVADEGGVGIVIEDGSVKGAAAPAEEHAP